MSVRAASKGKIDMTLEPSKIRERVVLIVIEHGSNVMDRHLICLSDGYIRGMQDGKGQE